MNNSDMMQTLKSINDSWNKFYGDNVVPTTTAKVRFGDVSIVGCYGTDTDDTSDWREYRTPYWEWRRIYEMRFQKQKQDAEIMLAPVLRAHLIAFKSINCDDD